jgi:hypothetical protein
MRILLHLSDYYPLKNLTILQVISMPHSSFLDEWYDDASSLVLTFVPSLNLSIFSRIVLLLKEYVEPTRYLASMIRLKDYSRIRNQSNWAIQEERLSLYLLKNSESAIEIGWFGIENRENKGAYFLLKKRKKIGGVLMGTFLISNKFLFKNWERGVQE